MHSFLFLDAKHFSLMTCQSFSPLVPPLNGAIPCLLALTYSILPCYCRFLQQLTHHSTTTQPNRPSKPPSSASYRCLFDLCSLWLSSSISFNHTSETLVPRHHWLLEHSIPVSEYVAMNHCHYRTPGPLLRSLHVEAEEFLLRYLESWIHDYWYHASSVPLQLTSIINQTINML